MKKGFRQSMAWLHTWSGLVVGWVLYFVFVTGTIGYFYVEIDRWMRPELPAAVDSPPPPAFLAKAQRYLTVVAPDADSWTIHLPGSRPEGANHSDLRWRRVADGDERPAVDRRATFDPRLGDFRDRSARETGGGHLLYRMHWQLHYIPRSAGALVVGACSMIMLVALISGVITHRKIFADIVTFRPGKGQRSWLDAHTVASVLALPFFVMITYSGLVFFAETYVPIAGIVPDQDDGAVSSTGGRSGRRAALRELDDYLTAAARYWGDGHVRSVRVLNPGDANAVVRLVHDGKETLLRDVGEELHFSGVDGRLIRVDTARGSAATYVESTLFGLHEGIFAGVVLRWLYFLSGLIGCVMVASGLLLWTAKRRGTSAVVGGGGFGHALVERLNIGTIAGLLVAIAAYFWANRLLPVDFADRAAWEAHGLFIVWGLMFVYAAVRSPRCGWVEELSLGGVAFALLPVLNALTTNRHLGVTLPAGDWALAGFDLTAMGFGIALGIIAWQTHRSLQGKAPARGAPIAPPAGIARGLVVGRRSIPARYRLAVASRVIAAAIGGYALTWLAAAAFALLSRDVLGVPAATAMLGATTASFLVYLVVVIAVFSARTATRAWMGLAVAGIPLVVLLMWLNYWSALKSFDCPPSQ